MKSLWPNEQLKNLAEQMVMNFGGKMLTQIPKDFSEFGGNADNFGVRFYSELLAALCKFESNYNPKAQFKESFNDKQGRPVISRGLLQVSIESANGYGAAIKNAEALHDPGTNLMASVLIMRKWIVQDGVITGTSGANPWLGMARYWSPFRNAEKLATMKKKMKEVMGAENIDTKFGRAYAVALGELNQKEIPGETHNPRILAYHAETTLKASSDEIPWCASFVNWVLKQIGEVGSRSALAKSFLDWGTTLKEPVKGCVCVFDRDGGGHVAFFDHLEGESVFVLGGNQDNKVSLAPYPKSKLLSYRGFPEKGNPLEAVKLLQSALNGVGVTPKLAVDGVAGPKTKAALTWAASKL